MNRWVASIAGGSVLLLATSAFATPPVAITEWMYTGSSPAGGEFVEFTNLSTDPVDMTGWSFDDDHRVPGAFDLSPFGIVMPGESVILTEDPAEQFRADWNLPPSVKIVGALGAKVGNNLGRNDEINLYDAKGQLVDRLAYGDQAFPGSPRTRWFSGVPSSPDAIGANDPTLWRLSAIGDADGAWASAHGDIGTPGAFSIAPPASSPVRVNEIMASNNATIADEDGDFPDWIELHNASDEPASLAGFGLSDNASNPFKWVLPEVTIEPGGFLLIFASGKDRTSGTLHTNFSISAAGEPILLTHPAGTTIDLVDPVAIATDVSWGRQPDGHGPWWYFDTPTPGAPNTGEAYLLSPPVTFSHTPGFHAEPFELVLACEDPLAAIHYTIDGSTPTSASPLYEGPIPIQDRSGEPNLLSLIQTSPDEGWEVPANNVFKGTPIRAVAIAPTARPGPVATATYFIHPDGAGRYDLPVFSIVTDAGNLFDYEHGIYVPGLIYDKRFNPDTPWWARHANYRERGEAWERPGHLELFEGDGSPAIQQGIGLRIHGGASRAYRRKTLRLHARSEYGASTIDHAIFPGDPIASFRRLLLRNSGQDWDRTLIHDALLQGLIDGLNLETQAYRPGLVFINGEYWGIHNVRERLDEHYLASRRGVDPDAVDILVNNAVVETGSNAAFVALRSFIFNQDPAVAENFDFIASQMELDNHIAYFAFQIYIRNHDWPQNNVRYWRSHEPGSRWRWMVFDLDLSFLPPNHFQDSLHRAMTDTTNNARIFQRLLLNEDYRRDFINRLADLPQSTFRPDRVLARIDEMGAAIASSIPEHIGRWTRPATVTSWQGRLTNLQTFAQQRPAFARQHVVANFSLPGTTEVAVEIPSPDAGQITISTIELPQGSTSWSGVYFQTIPVPIRGDAAPGFTFAGFLEIDATPDEEGLLWWTPTTDTQTLTAQFTRSPDLNGDGVVNGADLAELLASWGPCPKSAACPADLDGNGVVGGADLAIMLGAWGPQR